MKNKILILSFILLYFQNNTLSQDTLFHPNTRIKAIIFKNSENKAHGRYFLYSEIIDNKLLIEGNYNNGLKDGIWTFYNHLDSIRDSVISYNDGHANGPFEIFELDYQSKKEQIKQKGSYKNGKLHGDLLIYGSESFLEELKKYEDGIWTWQEIYWNSFASSNSHMEDHHIGPIKNNQRHGKWKTYHGSGLYVSYEYVNGNQEGEEIIYYPNGKIKTKFIYKNGEINGPAIYYHQSGKQIAKAEILNDDPINGTVAIFENYNLNNYYIDYYKGKNKIKTEHFENSKLYAKEVFLPNRVFRYYYKNGVLNKLTREFTKGEEYLLEYWATFKNNKLDSVYVDGFFLNLEKNETGYYAKGYHKNGQLARYGELDTTEKGIWYYYDTLGKIISQMSYKNGKRDGLFIFYDHQNQEQDTFRFKNGARDGRTYEVNRIEKFIEIKNYTNWNLNGPYCKLNLKGDTLEYGRYIIVNDYTKKTGKWKYYNYSGEYDSLISYYSNDYPNKNIYYKNGLIKKFKEYKSYVEDGIYYEYDNERNLLDSIEYSFGQIKYRNEKFFKNSNIKRFLKSGDSNINNVIIAKDEFGVERTEENLGTTLEILDVYRIDTVKQKNNLILSVTKDWKGMKGWNDYNGQPSYVYFADGSIKEKKQNDTIIEYYHNGHVKYFNSKIKNEIYYPNGKLKYQHLIKSDSVESFILLDHYNNVIYQYKINAYHGINKKINESQEGFWKEYGGELFSTRLVNYKNNERQGPYIVINRDEPLVENYVSERGFYKNNQLHDTIRYFDDIGHLYYLKVYDSGKLLYEKSIPNAETEINLKRELVDIINENGNIAITKSEIFDLQTRDKIGSFDLTYQSQKTFLSDNGEFLVSLCVQYGDLGQYPFLVMQNLKSGQELQFGDDPNPFFAFFSNNDSILNVISYKSYFQKSKIRDTIITELVYSEYQTKPFDLTLKKRTIINNREHPIYIKKISKNRIAEVHLNKVYYLNSETYKVIDSIILPLLNHLEKDEKFQFHNDLLSIRNNANEVTLVDLKTRKTIYIKNKNIANLPLFKSYLNNDAYLVSAKHFFRVDLNSGNLQKIKNPLNTNNLILTRKNNWLYTNYQNDYNSYNDGYNMSNYIPKKINNNSLKIGWYSINGKETIKEFSDTEYGMPYILNLDVSKNNLKIIDFNRSQDNIINLNLKSGISTTNSISGKESNDIYYKSIADTIIEKYYVGDYQQGVFYSMIMKDDKIIETNNYSNGQIQFTNPLYPDYRGEKVKYFTFSNGTELFLCRDHYFMSKGSNNGLLGFRMNLKYYSSEQFDLKYNRPDIILERLGYADSSTIASYHSAYLKRLKRMGFTEDMLKDDFHLPEIKIKNFEYLPTLTDSSDLNLDLDIKDSKYKLDRINIFINDVPVFGTAGIDLRKENIQEINKKINLSLSEGENKIQVSVLNQAGAESYKETVYITYKPKKPVQPDLYLVTIGDSKYSDSRYDLTYASKDATDIKTAFEKNSNSLYGAVYAFNYTDTQVTKENILKLKSELQKAKRDDVVIITVAGHGVLDKNLDYYLATHDMDFSNPSEKGLPYEELESLLDGIAPLKKVLFLDACHSGEVDKEEVELLATNTTTNSKVKFRNAGAGIQKKNLGLKTTSELMSELFTDLRRGTGATVISSAGGAEYAMESEEWKNGLFTYCLLHGLQDKASDENKDGQIMLSELQNYLRKEVTSLSNGAQQPTSRIENLSMDFRVW